VATTMMETMRKRFDTGQDYTAVIIWSLINPRFACLFLREDYNDLRFEKANPSRGGDAKSWIFQSYA